jgi:Tfp pilus assembly protein PilF
MVGSKKSQHKIFEQYRTDSIVCMCLVILTLAVYWQVLEHPFIQFDDDLYVTGNEYVRKGLTKKSLCWAFSFTGKDKTYWHPLTWLSHMLDCHLFGLNSGMHHLTNLIFHIANSMVLFLVLRKLTGEQWKSAFVAGLFALHPFHVDSVAWVAERKNVLSTFFWMLTLFSYAVYAKRPHIVKYLVTCFIFMLGLMAKPMLVTLPFVLLLMDYWPLKRMGPGAEHKTLYFLCLEKVPLLFLSLISVFIATQSVKGFGTVISLESVPLGLRIANGLVSYIHYITKTLWPRDFAIFYPYPLKVPLWQSVGAFIILAGISAVVFRAYKDRAYLGVGWLWYLGTLVPVIGLVQVGLWPAMADRFTYIPLIGLFIMIVWGVPDLMMPWKIQTKGLVMVAATVFPVLSISTWHQLGYWTDSIKLYSHALQVTDNNFVIHHNMGVALAEAGQTAKAFEHYSEALRINPNFIQAHINLGADFARQGRNKEAIHHYLAAIQINSDSAEAHCNLGNILADTGRIEAALFRYREALRINPNFADAHYNLANVLSKNGNHEEAVRHYLEALRIDPDFSRAHNNLGLVLINRDEIKRAIAHFKAALIVNPENSDARNNLEKALKIKEEPAQ